MKHFEDDFERTVNDDYEFNTMSHMKEENKKDDEDDDYGSLLFRHWIRDLDEYENGNVKRFKD